MTRQRAPCIEYTEDLADEICERIADGESLRTICRDEHMPVKTSVFRWLAANEDFAKRYARAREEQADTIFDECLDIVDDSANDWIERRNKSGDVVQVLNEEAIARSRLRLDARKWMAGKLRPKKYGDKVALTGGSADDDPIRLQSSANLDALTREQLEQLLSLAIAADAARGDSGGDREEED